MKKFLSSMMIIITVLVCGMSMQSCTSKDFDEAVENTFDGIAANIRLKGTWDRKDRIPSDVRTIRYLKLNQDDGNWEFTLVEVLGDQKIVNTGTWKTTGKYSVIVLKVKNGDLAGRTLNFKVEHSSITSLTLSANGETFKFKETKTKNMRNFLGENE